MQLTNAQPSRLRAMSRALGAMLGRSTSEPEAKASAVAPLIAIDGHRQPVWAPRDYATFAREGLMTNPVAYRCVRMIAESAASVPLLLYDRDTEIEDHPLLDLIASPAPGQTSVDLLEALLSMLLVSGNAFIEAVATTGAVRELYVLRTDRVQVVPNANGWSDGYTYTAGGQTLRLEGEAIPGVARILHMRFHHPLNDHYGLSPMEAAATAIDIHNEAARWNKALLDNSARPSGALVYGSGASMTPAQFERLKSELEESFQGARNAGRPLLLEGGLDWKAMSLSPRDMDFIALKQMAAREIALALGVPPLLLGLPGDNTYANYQEANRTFWRQTVIPLSIRAAKALSGWLGQGLELRPDLDQLEALSPDREALWARLEAASFLTQDERRAAAGYGPAPATEGDDPKFNPHHDAAGRFTSGPGGGATPIATKPRGPAGPPPSTTPKLPTTLPATPPKSSTPTQPDFLAKRPGPGTLTGKLDGLTQAEQNFAKEMTGLGKNVEIVPTGPGRTPDLKIDGKPYELKTVSGVARTDADGLSSAISIRIMNGRGQAGDIIVDARQQAGMTMEAAAQAAKRAFGADLRNGIQSITIRTPSGALSVPRR